MEILSQYIPNFFFILIRAGITLTMLPFFSDRNFPPQFRIGVIVAISIVLTPVVAFSVPKSAIPVVVIREIMFGMVFGLAARFIFFAVDMAGQVMAAATGLSMATAFDPEIGPSTDISRLYTIIAMLLFLALDAHHDLIAMFVRSYEWLPVGTVNVANLLPFGVSFATKIFIIGLKLSAPIVIVMLVTNVILGFIYKAAPQMNVFFVGQPVYIFLGLLTMMICLPVFAYVMGGYFTGIKDEMGRVILLMKG